MKIELKKIEYSERLSEETEAFSADLYINGKKAGEASNSGHGGSTGYRAYDAEGMALIREAEDWCKRLPPKVYPPDDSFPNGLKLDMDLEQYIDDLVNDFIKRRFQAKMSGSMKQHVVLSNDPEVHYATYKLVKPIDAMLSTPDGKAFLTRILTGIRPELKKDEMIINTNIPEDILKAAGFDETQYIKSVTNKPVKNKTRKKQGRTP